MIRLAKCFTTFTADEIDLVTEFRDYRAISDSDLPRLGINEHAALDHFWAAVAEIQSIADSEMHRYGLFARLAKILLVQTLIRRDYSAWYKRLKQINENI